MGLVQTEYGLCYTADTGFINTQILMIAVCISVIQALYFARKQRR